MQTMMNGKDGKPVITGEPIPEKENKQEEVKPLVPLIKAEEVAELFGKKSEDITDDDVMRKTRDIRLSLINHSLKQNKLVTTAMGISAIAGLLKDQEDAIQKERKMKNDLEVAATGANGLKDAILEVFKTTTVFRGIDPKQNTEGARESNIPEPVDFGNDTFKPGEGEIGKSGDTYETFMARANRRE